MLITIMLGFIGAICWGVAPIFGKMGLANINLVDAFLARVIISLAFLTIWVLSTGGLSRMGSVSAGAWIYLGMEAFLTTLAGDFAYFAALKWGSAGITAVALSASPVVTIILSSIVFHETFTRTQIIGVVFVIIGIFLVLGGVDQFN